LAEIRLKTVERAQLNFRHDFGRISSKLAESRPKSVAEIQLRAFDRF
jgi:hypothetical protein